MTPMRITLCLVSLSLAIACGPPSGNDPDDKVNLNAVPSARASCEEPTTASLKSGPEMLPGRVCQECHKKGGQAANFVWTISGTVYGSQTSACNTGGVAGVTVEVTGMDGKKVTLTTNGVGNFYTTQPITTPVRAKITKGGKTQEMFAGMSTASCATCHQNPPLSGAPGRIFLN